MAFRIEDTGADGGIIVSPLGLQEGAKNIAGRKNIHIVILYEESTIENYVLQFLNEVMVGFTEKITISDSAYGFITEIDDEKDEK